MQSWKQPIYRVPIASVATPSSTKSHETAAWRFGPGANRLSVQTYRSVGAAELQRCSSPGLGLGFGKPWHTASVCVCGGVSRGVHTRSCVSKNKNSLNVWNFMAANFLEPWCGLLVNVSCVFGVQLDKRKAEKPD